MPIDRIPSAALESGVPTRSQLPAGSVLQVVQSQSASFSSTTTVIPLDNTAPQITEGTEFLTATITPTSATSRLKIDVVINLSASPANWVCAAVFQDSTVNALASSITYIGINTASAVVPISYIMTAGTTSATTFRLRYGPGGAGTCYVNGSNIPLFNNTSHTSLTVTEIAA